MRQSEAPWYDLGCGAQAWIGAPQHCKSGQRDLQNWKPTSDVETEAVPSAVRMDRSASGDLTGVNAMDMDGKPKPKCECCLFGVSVLHLRFECYSSQAHARCLGSVFAPQHALRERASCCKHTAGRLRTWYG